MLLETDTYLIESIKKGNYDAFEMVFRSYYSILCKYAAGMVNSSSTAEDVVSDVLIKFWEYPDKIHINKSLKGYLFRSVHNACINYLTRKKKRFQELDHDMIEKLNTLLPLSDSDIPAYQLIGKELESTINSAVATLPPECSKVFILSRHELMSHREIARRLHISENTVKVQIYRALSKIRKVLQNYL